MLRSPNRASDPRIDRTVSPLWFDRLVGSKPKRHAARLKRLRKAARTPLPLDRHATEVLSGIDYTERWLERLLATGAPAANARAVLEEISSELASSLQKYDAFELCELLRAALLPWSVAGETRPGTEKGPALAEVLMLVALSGGGPSPVAEPDDPNAQVETWQATAYQLLTVAQIEVMARAHLSGNPETLTKIQLSTTFREVWMRQSSYPDMVAATLRDLFGTPTVEEAMRAAVGFTALEALAALDTIHDLQTEAWTRRLEATFTLLDDLMASDHEAPGAAPADAQVVEFKESWASAWNAKHAEVAISPETVSAHSGVSLDATRGVIDAFRFRPPARSIADNVVAFASGDNPWRTNPLLVDSEGSVVLLHYAMNVPAVRENSEQLLRGTDAWDAYQTHRGKVLEDRVRDVFEKLLPGARVFASYDYYVPSNEREDRPHLYTKRVEGDLLVVLDDVAVVVESKAIATNPQARAGDTRKLRRDLVGMIGNASRQAGRTASRIRQDGGLRLHREGWLDLAQIREIHLIAVSLDDLAGVATATGDLIDAGILTDDDIPWTVSLHDLQLIGQLVETPAEFLLYLRRRRDAETSRFFAAPDELDLFLYFLNVGLYVPPDPDKVHQELPFMRADTASRRRRDKQGRQLITTRTDPLDRWHQSVLHPELPPAPKPVLQHSPMKDLAAELANRRDFGWLSIGASLLSGSTKTQADMTRHPAALLKNRDPLGRERSLTMPIGSTKENAWLLVWITRPRQRSFEDAEEHARGYLHAKKYQLGITRAVALQYSEETRKLEGVFYEGARLEPDPELDEKTRLLVPPDQMPRRLSPKAKKRGRRR